VIDWIRGVAQKEEGDKLLASLKSRMPEQSASWRRMPYKKKDGRTYKLAFVTAQDLYEITQRLDVNTGLRNVILEFLAKSGVFVDTMRRDPNARAEFGATAG
jgi:hypothetical protein